MNQTPAPLLLQADRPGCFEAQPADTVTNGCGEPVIFDAVNGWERGFFHGEHYGEE